MSRLHTDLGVSWTSMPLVLDLLDRIHDLERELAKVAAAFHANFIVKSDTHAHKAFGAGLADLTGDKP